MTPNQATYFPHTNGEIVVTAQSEHVEATKNIDPTASATAITPATSAHTMAAPRWAKSRP